MPFRKLKLLPGTNLQQTPTLNQTQMAQTNLCRFYAGLIEKIGGWAQLSPETFVGTCRGMGAWADIAGNPYLALGTDQRLELLVGGTIFDITPIFETTNNGPTFFVTTSSPVVQIYDTYIPSAGDWINVQTQVSVGGIIVFGYYQVVASFGSYYTIVADPAEFTSASLLNDGGVLQLGAGISWPTTSGGAAGSMWSNGGVCSVVPGVTPDPTAAPVFFGLITAGGLLTLGGGNLPTTGPTPGSLQLWNFNGTVYVA